MTDIIRNAEQYLEAWRQILAEVLEQIAGAAMPCAVLREAPADLAPANATDSWIVGACQGGLRGEMALRCSAASTGRLAQLFMNEPVTADDATAEHREAVVELLRQAGGLVASALKPGWGEVQVRVDVASSAPTWPASSTAWLQIGSDPPSAPVIEIQLSAALVAALQAPISAPSEPPPVSVPLAEASGTSPANLDLLMDVELAVSLRFGGRRMLLREVLDLSPGSVVELDRRVEEPVDILLDGRIVARGEVVVVEGNYGLRVTEVAPSVAL